MIKQKQEELVYVVPRNKVLGGKAIPNGFHTQGVAGIIEQADKYGRFIRRSLAEYNPDLKQLIPYMIVSFKGKASQNNTPVFLLLHRKNTQTEKRLHNKYSLGVGGHINPVKTKGKTACHLSSAQIIEASLKRELNEELLVTCPYTYDLVGYINDDKNAVGQVHLGLVYQLAVSARQGVSIAEKDLMSGRFLSLRQLRKYYPLMESWSQLVFKHIC